VPADVVRRAADFPSSILADVAGRRGALSGRIAALAPTMRFAGPALTVEVRPGDNLMIHAALAIAKPGDVIVVDGQGRPQQRADGRDHVPAGGEDRRGRRRHRRRRARRRRRSARSGCRCTPAG
jgi:hypothetical protein